MYIKSTTYVRHLSTLHLLKDFYLITKSKAYVYHKVRISFLYGWNICSRYIVNKYFKNLLQITRTLNLTANFLETYFPTLFIQHTIEGK